MPTPATAATTTPALASSLFSRCSPFAVPPLPPVVASSWSAVILAARAPIAQRRVSCQIAVSTDLSSSSAVEEEEQQAAAKIGKRVRVKVPLKVYHVQKAPELDLNGLEGVIKQYVGVWKGKRISANLPFKVEFQIDVEGQPRPVKFFAHLKEDEFEYLPSTD
ncbi:hypothetical protein OPV22_007137 [Ensete ventricosum]|uniref:Ferredoxin thioredoxin reductase alpha chain domain-containing protein n=2 Tax=Ensete ventricosum TaxID=4639 RepID=A0A445MCH8_ENSVE|nr:hypothetical protein OPV22_007137 [Ensete ventricosum]RWW24842.1 hypothetical protein GW17_00010850 [Ensete ventricosum]RWW81560.1 hypothetical protein BHE74_00010031 [Ensete ventricosum]RZR71972.1 hypothetical protein BHM03_00009207 [Ensete ventricosum]